MFIFILIATSSDSALYVYFIEYYMTVIYNTPKYLIHANINTDTHNVFNGNDWNLKVRLETSTVILIHCTITM